MLLALDPERGTLPFHRLHRLAIAGGVLAELLLDGAVRVEGEGWRGRVLPARRATAEADPVLREVARRLADDRPRSPGRWVGRLARGKRLCHDTATGLCRRGVLRNGERSFLVFFRRRVYPTLDAGPRRDAVRRLENALASDGPLELRDAALAGLACAAGLQRRALDGGALRGRRRRMIQLARGDAIGGAAPVDRAVASVLRTVQRAVAGAQAAAGGG